MLIRLEPVDFSALMSNNYLGESGGAVAFLKNRTSMMRDSLAASGDDYAFINYTSGQSPDGFDDELADWTSSTSSLPFFHHSNLTYGPWLSLVILVVAVMMSLATIIGNVLVITAFIIEKSLRKYSNYFILNLSIADLLIGILIPPYAPFLLLKREWRLGKAACTIWLVLDYVVGSASVLCIVVISLDRYLLVSRGLDYVAKQKVYRAILIMVTVWVIAFLNYAPAIIFWEVISGVQTVKDGECQVAFYDNLYYLTATACVEFFAPLISICGLNLAVYLNIKTLIVMLKRKRSRGLIRSENPKFTLNQETTKANNIAATPEATATATITDGKNRGSQFSTGAILDNSDSNRGRKRGSFDEPEKRKLAAATAGKVEQSKSSSTQQQTSERLFNDSVGKSSSTASSLSLDDAVMLELQKKERQGKRANVAISLVKKRKTTSFVNAKNNGNKGSVNAMKLTKKRLKSITTNIGSDGKQVISTAMETKTATATMTSTTAPTYSKFNKTLSNSSSRTLTKDKKAARSLFILVLVFGICWAPYTFLTLIKSVCSSCVNEEAHEFTFWLLWFNSTLNPIIYPLLHVKFRKAFARILHSVFFCFNFEKSRSQYREVSMNHANHRVTAPKRRHNNV